jgi:hypothetical protein
MSNCHRGENQKKIEIKDYLPKKKWTRSGRYSAKEKGK